MKPEETIDFHIRWAWYKISRLYNQAADRYGSTMSVGYLLLNIDPEEGTPSTKLGPKMGMESRSLTRTINSVEEKGLISRVSDPDDKRMVRLFLTEEGKRYREEAREVVIHFNETVKKEFTKEELQQFFHIMDKLKHILDTKTLFDHEQTQYP